MNQQEIKDKSANYRRKINKYNRNIRLVQSKWRELQLECEHPNQYPTSDYSGGRGMLCPDCSRDTS